MRKILCCFLIILAMPIMTINLAEGQDRQERIGILKSSDGGQSWEKLGRASFDQTGLTPVDPCPLFLKGKWILYFYNIGNRQTSDFYRAESVDGVHFTSTTKVLTINEPATDPAVIIMPDGTYRMYISQGNVVISANSADGIQFTLDEGQRTDLGGVPGALLLPDNRVRLYVCLGGIGSLISGDGLNFTIEEGIRVTGDWPIVCDPHPIRLQDGTYMMVFKILEEGDTNPQEDQTYVATSADSFNWILGESAIVTQSSVPGLVQAGDGSLYVYYVDFSGTGDGGGVDGTDGDGGGGCFLSLDIK